MMTKYIYDGSVVNPPRIYRVHLCDDDPALAYVQRDAPHYEYLCGRPWMAWAIQDDEKVAYGRTRDETVDALLAAFPDLPDSVEHLREAIRASRRDDNRGSLVSTRLTKAEAAELIPAVQLLAAQLEAVEVELKAFVETTQPSLVRGVIEDYLLGAGGIRERQERVASLLEKLWARSGRS